ncbi:TPA: hypothetical protein ACH3X2_004059 [Trebouxia sp. C0005]
MPSEADMSSSDHLDTALAALDNPRVAQAPCPHSSASADVTPLAPCQPDICFFDASDSLDYKASLAEALARLCKRASEDGQAQSASQAVRQCQHQHGQTAAELTLDPPVAAAATDADAAADKPQSPAGPEENLNTACSVSADDAFETGSDDLVAMVDVLMTSEVQHAAVDQVVDDLLDEVSTTLQPMQSSLSADNAADTISDDLIATINALVSSETQHTAANQVVDKLLAGVAAPFQPAQSSVPADTSGMVSPLVSLPVNCAAVQHAAVEQVLDDLLAEVSAPLQPVQSNMPAKISVRVSPMVIPRVSLPANCFAPQQAVSLPAVPAPDGCCVSSTAHPKPLPPDVTAAKHSSAELLPVVASSNSSGKENSPTVEAKYVSTSKAVNQDRAVVGTMGRGRGRVCCLDRSTFQEMVQALPTEPSSQVRWMREKIADLGRGPAHLSFLTSLPPPSSALPIVLRLSTGNEDRESGDCSTVAEAAMLMWLCAHPNVVPIILLGLQAPVSPPTPLDPCQVAYFGMPMADLSLEKRMGQQVWGKRGGVGIKYQGPSLPTLVQHAKAVLKPLAHIHRSRVLHRGLTPDHVLLFSKGGQEADSGLKAASKPAAIKHDVKLAGFGAAARLNGQGHAILPSPYRCEEGYVPPEAHRGSLLTTAADVYQFGGLCYYMATGTHPPAKLHQASLPDCVAKEWRLMVSLCQADNPADRPTVAQLQLYLHTICHQPVKQPPQAVRSPAKVSPAVSAQRYTSRHRQGLPFPPISQGGVQALEIATSDFAAALPHMAANQLFTPSSTPCKGTPAEYKASSAAPSQTTSLTAAAPKSGRSLARAQRASAPAAQSLGAFISVPQLMLGVDQWVPEGNITCVDHKQGSTPSSYHAAAKSQQSNDGLDADTAAAAIGEAAVHLPRTAGGNSGSSHSIGSSQAAAGLLSNDIIGSARSSQLSCVEPASDASMILRAVASSHQTPACPNRSLCDLAGYGDTDSTAASGLLLPGTTGSKARGVLGYLKTAVPVRGSHAVTPLLMCTHNGEQEGRQSEAGQLVSPSRFHISSGLTRSPVALPRRDDTALEKGGVTRWIAQAQGKAAHLAAAVNERGAGMTEQTSTLLQQWSENQLSTKIVAVSCTAS